MIHLENARVALALDPAMGARVTALTDRATGRQWLVDGPAEGDPGEGAAYGAREARGWDECFPTVAPCEHAHWGRLRDHGALWGRPWEAEAGQGRARAAFRAPGFRFEREVALLPDGVLASYRVQNTGRAPFAWMWSQHGLLDACPGERLALDGLHGFTAQGRPFDWPCHEGRDLRAVGEPSEGFALKAYARAQGPARAALEGPEGGIAFAWDGREVPALGLWLSYGGWPPGGEGVHQVAIEPATAPADDLASAEALGAARTLAPGTSEAWAVRITLTAPRDEDRP